MKWGKGGGAFGGKEICSMKQMLVAIDFSDVTEDVVRVTL
jgi:hypothetical protein